MKFAKLICYYCNLV